MCMNNNPVNCNCIHCHDARCFSGQHDTNINRPHRTPNLFGQRQQQSTFNPFGQQPLNPFGQPWNQPHTPIWPQPDPYISRPYKPYDPLTPMSEEESLFENIINKPKNKNNNIKPIDDSDLLTMRIYDGLRSVTDDKELIQYFAFDVEYLTRVVDDAKYKHGYFHKDGAHLVLTSDNAVVVSTPKLKMVVKSGNVDFEVSKEIGKENASTLGKDILNILSLVRDVIESSTMYKSSKVEEPEIAITLEDFYEYITNSNDPVIFTFCHLDFSFIVDNNYVRYYIAHEDLNNASFGHHKSEPIERMAESIADYASRMGDVTDDIDTRSVLLEITRRMKEDS